MGLRAHTTRPRSPRDASFFLWKKHQTPLTKEGRCLHLCSSSPIPLVPAMPSPSFSRPQDPIDQFRILCSNLWPDSPPPRLDGCTHVGGLEPLFGAMAAPRQDEAKLGAKLQCILTQTCSPPRVTGNGRQPEQICVDAVSVVARGVVDDGQWTILDQNISTPSQRRRHPGIQFSNPAPTRAVAKMPRRPSLHISDRPARIGQSHLGRVDSASPLSTKAASRSRGILETTIPASPGAQFASSCCNPLVVVLRVARRINTSWLPPTVHAVPRRTSFPHHLQPRLNRRDLAIRADQNTTRI